MKQTVLKTGYLQIMLRKVGKGKKYLVHRLVASAFIPNPENLPQVDHIDGSRDNNAASNLRWCSAKGNMSNLITQERVEIGRLKVNFPYRFKTQQFKNGVLIKEYESAYKTKEYGFNPSSVIRCCNGQLKAYKGFEWHYVKD